MEEYNDKLHDLIKNRLAERDRKSQSIEKWNRKQNKANLRPIIGFAVAACMIGMLFLIPWQSPYSESDSVRAASGNIDELIKLEKYDDALILIDKEIYLSDSTLQALEQDTCANDEEKEYSISAIRMKLDDMKEKKNFVSKKIKK